MRVSVPTHYEKRPKVMIARARTAMAGGIALIIGLTGWVSPSGAAGDLGGFYATATAQGLSLTFTVPNFAIVEDFIDAGGPTSQAIVDSTGSRGYASLPYPGQLVLAGPGLFNTATGQTLPGGYPLYASAEHPTTPKQEVADPSGSYRLQAQAAEGRSDAVAHFGVPGGQTMSALLNEATTSSVVEGDTVTATAETVNEGLALGDGALRMASVRSRSVTTYRAGEPKPVTKTSFGIEGGSAGDMKFAYGPDGLVVGKQGVPLPVGAGLEQLNAVLAPAGMSLRLVGARDLEDGASANALDVLFTPSPPAGSGVPHGIAKLRIGGATSGVAAGEALPGIDLGNSAPFGSGEPLPIVQAPPPGDSTPATTGFSESAGSMAPEMNASSPSSSPLLTSTAPEALAPPEPEAAASDAPVGAAVESALAQPIAHPRALSSDEFVYGIMIAAGVAMMVVASLWRTKGVLVV